MSKLESVSEDPTQLADVGEWPALMFFLPPATSLTATAPFYLIECLKAGITLEIKFDIPSPPPTLEMGEREPGEGAYDYKSLCYCPLVTFRMDT